MTLHQAVLDITSNPQETREKKISKLDFIKIKKLCATNDTTKKVNKQYKEWGNYLQNIYLSNKDLYTEYIKSSYNSIKEANDSCIHRQMIYIVISSRNVYRWPIST